MKKRYIVGGILWLSSLVQARLRRYEFNITLGNLNPDCHTTGYNVPLINGQFPAPTIYATKGDEVEILVRNLMTANDTSIHFHGIRQIGTMDADGVPGVTQPPIAPGKSYLQKFKLINQAGTYYYHTHVGLQDDSAQGSFIIYESPDADPYDQNGEYAYKDLLKVEDHTYKNDIVIHLSEWRHEDLVDRESFLLGPAFRKENDSDSLLLNGATVFDVYRNWSDGTRCEGYTTFDVEPNSVYRFRAIGALTFRALYIGIAKHNLSLIEVDGELTKPYETSYLEVSPGQRYSALLHTGNHPPGTVFVIATYYVWRTTGGNAYTTNGFGYIRYVEPGSKKKPGHTRLLRPIIPNPSEVMIKPVLEESGDPVGGMFEEPVDTNNKPDKQGVTKEDAKDSVNQIASMRRQVDAISPRNTKRDDVGTSDPAQNYTRSELLYRLESIGRTSYDIYDVLPRFPNSPQRDCFYHSVEPLEKRSWILDQTNVRTIKFFPGFGSTPAGSRFLMNDRPPVSRPKPLLQQYKELSIKNYTSLEYNPYLDTYPIRLNETIDLVFQNSGSNSSCNMHPWHTHGHSHYLIASGEGSYIHEKHKNIRNFKNPLFRDTSIAYPASSDDGKNCGWTKVRIYADNPGFWAVHCHITSHMALGKMVVLEEAPELIESTKLYR